MKNIIKIRKALHLWDTRQAQDFFDIAEGQFTEVLLDLGVPEHLIDFDRNISYDGEFASILTIYESKTKNFLTCDDALLHPWCDLVTPDCIRICNSIKEEINEVSCRCIIYLDVKTTPEVKQTLWQIGKIKMEQPYVSQPQEVLACGW